MTKAISAKELEKIAESNDDCTFVNTKNGRLVMFNVDKFCWNAYGKDHFEDRDNPVTDDQWENFVSGEKYFSLNMEDGQQTIFDDHCQEEKIGAYKEDES